MTFKKIALLSSALIVAVAFSGCSKKPRRPNPIDTVMNMDSGRGAGNGGFGETDINPTAFAGEELPGLRNSTGSNWIDNAKRGILGNASVVYFNFDSTTIAPKEREKLNAAVQYLANNPNAKLVLEGHCDWRGTGEYNLALGDRRSKSIESFLVTLGVSSNKLQTLSKGDLDATEGASSAQMTKERKVELLVVR